RQLLVLGPRGGRARERREGREQERRSLHDTSRPAGSRAAGREMPGSQDAASVPSGSGPVKRAGAWIPVSLVLSSPAGIMDQPTIGKYRLVSRIGQGAMGEVFKAHDPSLNRMVAVKTISSNLGTESELRRRFLREAQSAARL